MRPVRFRFFVRFFGGEQLQKQDLRSLRARAANAVFVADYKGRRFDVSLKATKAAMGLIESSVPLERHNPLRLIPAKGTPEPFNDLFLLGEITKEHTARSLYEVRWIRLSVSAGFKPLMVYLRDRLGIGVERSALPLGGVIPEGMAVYQFESGRILFPDFEQRVESRETQPIRKQPERTKTQPSRNRAEPARAQDPTPGSSGFRGEKTPLPQPDAIFAGSRKRQAPSTPVQANAAPPVSSQPTEMPQTPAEEELLLPKAGTRQRSGPPTQPIHPQRDLTHSTSAADAQGNLSVYGVDVSEQIWEQLDNIQFSGGGSRTEDLGGPITRPITKPIAPPKKNEPPRAVTEDRIEGNKPLAPADRTAQTSNSRKGVANLLRKIAARLSDED